MAPSPIPRLVAESLGLLTLQKDDIDRGPAYTRDGGSIDRAPFAFWSSLKGF